MPKELVEVMAGMKEAEAVQLAVDAYGQDAMAAVSLTRERVAAN